MSERIDTVLVLNALTMALLHRRPPAKLSLSATKWE